MSEGKNNQNESSSDREIVISRVFDCPRELVWEAWTNPKHLVNWWGPNGFKTEIEEMDVKPGGALKQVMIAPDGKKYPNRSVFQEVLKFERLVYAHSGGEEGAPPIHFVFTWIFKPLKDGKTELTIRQVFETAEIRNRIAHEYGAIEGGKQTLARLAQYLPQVKSQA